jgi:hypothetical protein
VGTGPTAGPGDDRGTGPWVTVAGIGALAAAAAVALASRRRRRRAEAGPPDPVAEAWATAIVPVRARTGLDPEPSETHLEYAHRVAAALGDAAADLEALAAMVTDALWSPPPRPAGAATRVSELGERLAARLGPPG